MGARQASNGGWFLPVLTLLFITLKLTGHITWPWMWVLAPMWIPLAIALAVIALIGVFQGVIWLLERRTK